MVLVHLRIMQLANFLKVPVVFFFEDFPLYEGGSANSLNNEEIIEDLNYSYLSKIIFQDFLSNKKKKYFKF